MKVPRRSCNDGKNEAAEHDDPMSTFFGHLGVLSHPAFHGFHRDHLALHGGRRVRVTIGFQTGRGIWPNICDSLGH